MYCVRRYILHGILRYALHHMRHNALLGIRRGVFVALRLMCCAVRKQNPAANGSLIERAHIFPDANGRILPNKKTGVWR